MRIAKFFLLASLLVAAAACAPKQKEAAEPSALDVIFSRNYLNFNFLSLVSNSKLPICFRFFCPMTHCSTILLTTLHSTL